MIVLAILAAVFGFSASCFVAVVTGTDLSFSLTRKETKSTLSGLDRSVWIHITLAIAGAVLIIVLSGAVVAGLSIGAIIYGLPKLVENRRAGNRELARIDAMAAFAGQMAQSFGGGTGLAKTVIDASLNPPAAIRDEVIQLRASLEAGSFSSALTEFANNVGTPHAAKLAANLIAAEQENATALQQRLVRIAKGAQQTAQVSRGVKRDRRTQAFQVKAITIVLGIVVASVLLGSPETVELFSGSIAGELRLSFVAGVAISAWFMSERLNENVALENFTLRRGAAN